MSGVVPHAHTCTHAHARARTHTHTHTHKVDHERVFNNFLETENPHLPEMNLLCLGEHEKATNIWKYFWGSVVVKALRY
jgi:hypothetical protein